MGKDLYRNLRRRMKERSTKQSDGETTSLPFVALSTTAEVSADDVGLTLEEAIKQDNAWAEEKAKKSDLRLVLGKPNRLRLAL